MCEEKQTDIILPDGSKATITYADMGEEGVIVVAVEEKKEEKKS